MGDGYLEPERTLPLRGRYDVVVAGGGIAGVAAAVAAARNGASVCLVEKEYALGGLATLGLVVEYLPICDGRGRQVCGGLAEELLLLAAAEGGGEVPACWKPGGDPAERRRTRYALEFNPASYILALEQLVSSHEVVISYDTRSCGVVARDGTIDALIVEDKAGRGAIACEAIVDATGDADICAFSGEPTTSLATNSAAGWYYSLEDGGPRLHKLSQPFDPTGTDVMPGAERGYAGVDPADVTAQLLASRDLIRDHLARVRRESPGRRIVPFLVPTFPGFRMTRRLAGRIDFEARDRDEYPDSVGLIGDWRTRGPIYCVPLRALHAVRNRNLFVSGRCISSVGYGWDMTRVIPPCAVTGEAAGTACAILVGGRREGVGDERFVAAVQDRLRRAGNRLFLADLA